VILHGNQGAHVQPNFFGKNIDSMRFIKLLIGAGTNRLNLSSEKQLTDVLTK